MALGYFIVATIIGTLMLAGILSPTQMLKAAHAHLALLGWVSSTLMGVMYQQVPTLTSANLYSKRIGEASFLLFNSGVISQFLVFIFLGYSTALIFTSALVLSGMSLFSFNILYTLRNKKADSPVLKFYGTSVIYFVSAGIFGLAIAIDKTLFNFGGLIIPAHTHLAVLGWVSLAIMGAMSWMFPMVLMRDLKSPRLLDSIFWFFNIGAVGFFIGLLTGGFGIVTKFSALIIGVSVILFAYLLLGTATRKVKMQFTPKSTEGKFFTAGIAYFILAVSLGMLMLFGMGGAVSGIKILHVHMALVGFVSVTIFGGMYHIIPMICWTRVVGKMAGGRGPMPSSFKDLYSDRLATIIFVLLNIGIIGFFMGFALGIRPLAIASAISINSAGVIFAFDMLRVIIKS